MHCIEETGEHADASPSHRMLSTLRFVSQKSTTACSNRARVSILSLVIVAEALSSNVLWMHDGVLQLQNEPLDACLVTTNMRSRANKWYY
jgi:hypothetical protein